MLSAGKFYYTCLGQASEKCKKKIGKFHRPDNSSEFVICHLSLGLAALAAMTNDK
jgi:hypothetical protein